MFIDVRPSDWYYDPISELNDTPTYGYVKFLDNIPYNVMEANAPIVDKIFYITEMTSVISLGVQLAESINNPISVYLNGAEIGYLKIESTQNDTLIYLRRYVPQGSFVRVVAWGVPRMTQNLDRNAPNYDPTGGPVPANYTGVKMPSVQLGFTKDYPSYVYVYNPAYRHFSEVVRLRGTQLRRVPNVPDTTLKRFWREGFQTDYVYVESEDKFYEWNAAENDYASTYTPTDPLIYTITSGEKLVTSPHLNNEFVTASYLIGIPQNGIVRGNTYRTYTENTYASSSRMVYTNRFFPAVYTTRLQTLLFLDRLTVHLLLTYSSKRKVEEVLSDKEYTDSAFKDIRELDAEPWWWKYIRNLEDLRLSDGTYLLNYGMVGEALPDSRTRPANAQLGYLDYYGYSRLITRGEMANLLNKFRKYYIEVLG